MVYCYGLDVKRKDNLHVLSDTTIAFVAGGVGIIYDLYAKTQYFLQPSVGNSTRHLTVHPLKICVAAAEHGPVATVNVFEYPSLRLVSRLRSDGDKDIVAVHFNREGSHILTVNPAPSYMLTIWDWENETAIVRSKASTNYPIIRAKFATYHTGLITSAGIDHIKFWNYHSTDSGWEIHCTSGKYGSRATSTIECFVVLALRSVITAASDGAVYKWTEGEIVCEVLRSDEEKLHDGIVTNMSTYGRNLLTLGTDGFIKLWSWDQLEGPTDKDGIFLDVMQEFQLGAHNIPVHMVHFPGEQGSDHNENCWLVLDDRGLVWKVNFQSEGLTSTPSELLYVPSAPVRSVTADHLNRYFAAADEDGNIRVYNNDRKACLAQLAGERLAATALCWINAKTVISQNSILTGYADGTIKLLALTDMWSVEGNDIDFFLEKTAPALEVAFTRNMQRNEINQLALNSDNGIIGSISTQDSTLLLLQMESSTPSYFPIALYKTDSPLYFCWKRFNEHFEMCCLLSSATGQVLELLLPDSQQEETLKAIAENESAELESDVYQKSLVSVNVLNPKVFELKSIKARLESTEADVRNNPSRIVWVMYDPLDQHKFWMTTTDFDAGYLYCCAFDKEVLCEPIQAIKVDGFLDITINSALFLDHGQLMLVSTTDGQVRIFLLQQRYVLESRISTWAFKVHVGVITALCAAADNTQLYTAGLDGNIVNFRLDVPDTATALLDRRFFRDVLSTFRNTKLTDKEDRELTKFMRAEQRWRSEAERNKETMMEEVEKLKNDIRAIIAENATLPKNVQIPESDFVIHSDIYTAMNNEFERRLRDAHAQNITERVKGRIVIDRLLTYLRGDLEEVPEIKVTSFGGTTEIPAYWIQKLNSNIDEEINELEHKISEAKGALDCTQHNVPCRLREEFFLESLTSFELTGATHDSNGGEKTLERIKFQEHLDRAKMRRQQWRALFNRKPNVTEENELFLAEERKRISGQEYKIKDDENHAIQFMAEYYSAPEIKLRLLQLKKEIHNQKTQFNNRLLQLQEEKVNCIRRIKEYDLVLEKVQKKLTGEKRKSLGINPEMGTEPTSQKSLRPTYDECLQIYQLQQEAELLRKQKEAVEKADIEKENMEFSAAGKPRFARLQSFTTRQIRLSMQADTAEVQEESVWDHLEYTVSEEEKEEQEQQTSLLLYEQENIIKAARALQVFFDGKLNLLRHDKFALDIELKRADLHLLMYHWEYEILNKHEDREKELSREEAKLRERKSITERRLRMLEPDLNNLQNKLRVYREREDRIKQEFDAQLRNVMNQRRFRGFLTNIFNHNIKGHTVSTRVTAADDGGLACIYRIDELSDSVPDAECSISSLDIMGRRRSSLARSSLQARWAKRALRASRHSSAPKSKSSLLDFNPEEILVCPRDLDKKVFQAMHNINRQHQRVRRDIDDEIDRNREIMEISFEAREELEFIQFFLSEVSASLHALRLEKFNSWKDLPFAIVVRLDQVRFGGNQVLRSDLYNALAFDETKIEALSTSIEQIRQETITDERTLAQLREEYAKLEREQIVFSQRIEELKTTCRSLMLEKYGSIVDLDQADNVRNDSQIKELQEQIATNQKRQDAAVAMMKKRADAIWKQLTAIKSATTSHLKTIAQQMLQRDELAKHIDKRAERIGRGVLENATAEEMRQHEAKLIMWETMAQTQLAEIDALATEVAFFKSKDTNIAVLKETIARRYREANSDIEEIFAELGLQPDS
ncbi:cilia- and flagella-associated protein 44-like isoform X2 [Paramacrobiotus metropolitanus]|nr:cilia- and flagella-associated protein 44-like isoform X2 [Paramacrobiotus metropolitanus]